jgi:glutathione S-transferase
MTTQITLWGRKTSANVQKVVWTLEEIGVGYEHIELGGKFGGLDRPAYRTMNPNAKVPTLRDGELVIWESNAIVRYLAAQYASGLLYPTEPVERAIVDQWTDWTGTTFQPAWIGVFWNVYRTKPANRNAEKIRAAYAEAHACLAILEDRLSHVPYLAGEDLTHADIVAGIAGFRWYTMGIDTGNYPAVQAWYERLSQRPAYRKGVMVPYDELRETF